MAVDRDIPRKGRQCQWTTAYFPPPNGMLKRQHRTLKAAIMARGEPRLTYNLPAILLGSRTAAQAEFYASSVELVYGEKL